MPKIIVALFIIVILVAIWFLYQQKAKQPGEEEENNSEIEYQQQEPTPVEPVEEEEQPEETEQPVQEEPEQPTQTISSGTIDGETTTYELSGTDTMNIRIEVSGDTWVGIRDEAGSEQIEDRVYKAGEVVEFDATANAYARIRLGDSTVAKVFINDVELQYAQKITTQNIIITLQQEEQ